MPSLAGKVQPPERTRFHLERPALLTAMEATDWTVVAVNAPAGFGKTTLLAEACRRARDRNTVAAWLSVDEHDTVDDLALCLACAFEVAGLGIAGQSAGYSLAALLGKIERLGTPSVLVIDDVERIASPVVGELDFLVRNAPANLRILLGMERNPGLDLSEVILDGRGAQFGADWLRFSRSDIAAYFGAGFSRRELAELTRATAGWPIAASLLRLRRSTASDAEGTLGVGSVADDRLATDWLENRLFARLGEDYEFVLDLGQFDWIDPEIVDEVLGIDDSAARLAGLAVLDGLVQPDDGAGSSRLHELVRRHCAAALRRRNPERYAEVHRAIARALAARGHVGTAAWHAREAGDADLVGDIYHRAGAVALFVREGMNRLGLALELLTDDVTEGRPRLALLRCRMLVHQSRLPEARTLYERTRLSSADFTRDAAASDAQALSLEASYLRAVLIGCGCTGFEERAIDELTASHHRARSGEADRSIAAAHAGVLIAAYQMQAMFDEARRFARLAAADFAEVNSVHGTFHANMNMGVVAMATGRTGEAERHYSLARRIADEKLADRRLRRTADVLLAELHLECNRMDAVGQLAPEIPVPFRNGTAWFDVILAAHDVVARWRFETGGVEAALAALQTLYDDCESAGMPAACRQLAGSRVAYLALDGRIEEADREWSAAMLPQRDEDILQLRRQAWREMETLACARLRLLTASERWPEARRLAMQLSAFAEERGLVRTLMRCLALSIALEHRAGDSAAAAAHLLAYLARLPESGFSAPLIHDPDARRVLADVPEHMLLEPQMLDSVQALRRQCDEFGQPATPRFSEREREIIELLALGRRDKEIARQLSLSVHGVRFHLRSIYRKTGTSRRAEAVNWAIARGIVEG